jgi:hypothetical protein
MIFSFDKNHRAFGRAILYLVLFTIIYVGSFCVIRASSSSEECSLVTVDIATDGLCFVYRPMIGFDKYLNRNVIYSYEIDEVRSAKHYFCGE